MNVTAVNDAPTLSMPTEFTLDASSSQLGAGESAGWPLQGVVPDDVDANEGFGSTVRYIHS